MKNRVLCLFVIFGVLLFGLTVRLAVIQLIEGSKYRLLAENQSQTALSDISVRGTIYDRSNRPLTNIEESFFLLIEDRKVDENAERLLSKMDARYTRSDSKKYRIYNVAAIDRRGLKILCRDYGAIAMKSRARYSEDQPAMHMIGYVDRLNKSGISGIEKDFDAVLVSGLKQYSVRSDGQGYIIPGSGIIMKDDGREWGVLTTLDLNIQNTVERILSESGKSGVVVITHIPSGEILASACAPGYNPYLLDGHINGDEQELLNKATSASYPAGPFFYLLTAAAVTPESFIETANAFALSEEAIELLSGQVIGNLSDFEEALKAGEEVLANGQDLLMISPMQAARMTRIIALDGWDSKLTVIRGTVEGIRGVSFLPKSLGRQVISSETTRRIREAAQGVHGPNWYSGFVPAEEPLYGITLYIEDDVPGESVASSMFRKIASSLYP